MSDAHRAERRRQILAGARRAFARYGYESATVARLEEEIGLSRGAIFSYFPNKWELFFALASEDHMRLGARWLDAGFEGAVRQLAEEDPDWIAVYLETARLLRTDPARRAQWETRDAGLHIRIEEHLVNRRAEGLDRSDVPLKTVDNFLGVVLDGLAVHLSAGFPIDVDGTIELVRSALAPK